MEWLLLAGAGGLAIVALRAAHRTWSALLDTIRQALPWDGFERSPRPRGRIVNEPPGPETGAGDWYTDFILLGDPTAPSRSGSTQVAGFMEVDAWARSSDAYMDPGSHAELSPEAVQRIWANIEAELDCRCPCHRRHDARDFGEAVA